MQTLNSTNNIIIAPHFNLSEFACPCCNLVMLHPKLLAKLVEDYAEEIDFNGIGFYEKKNFLHLDVRPTKRSRWRE